MIGAARHRQTVANMRREFREHPQRGIPRRYWGDAWGDFHFDLGGESNAGRVSALRKYANEFPVDASPAGQKSIILAAKMNGVGKTMLASLIVGEIIGNFEKTGYERCPFQFWSVNNIRMRLKAADRYGSKETQEEVYRDFATMWLLVMDDVGKEQLDGRDAGFTYEMYFNILDQRYNNQLPVVITSNLAPEPWEPGGPCLVDLMGRASVSRLGEMTGGMVYRRGSTGRTGDERSLCRYQAVRDYCRRALASHGHRVRKAVRWRWLRRVLRDDGTCWLTLGMHAGGVLPAGRRRNNDIRWGDDSRRPKDAKALGAYARQEPHGPAVGVCPPG